jgi:hypothetical protein
MQPHSLDLLLRNTPIGIHHLYPIDDPRPARTRLRRPNSPFRRTDGVVPQNLLLEMALGLEKYESKTSRLASNTSRTRAASC